MAAFLFNMMGGAAPAPSVFAEDYRVRRIESLGRYDLERGDKIILPNSALQRLSQLRVQFPMMFKLRNMGKENASTHCSVLEFSAPEGVCYVPHWIMQSLLLQDGALINVRNVQLPKGTFVKLRPHTSDFLDISDPRAVLERELRSYSALTKGGTLMFYYRGTGKSYYLDVLDTKPADAVSIIETDLSVDFAAPLDYKEPERVKHGGGGASTAAASGKSAASAIPLEDMDEEKMLEAAIAASLAAAKAEAAAVGSAAASASGPAAGGAGLAPLSVGGAGGSPALTASAGPASSKPKPGTAEYWASLEGKGLSLKDSSGTGSGKSLGAAGAGGAGESKGSPGGGLLFGGAVTPSAGGLLLTPTISADGSGGGGGGTPKPKTLNKFEAKRQQAAFQGQGNMLK